MKHKKGLSVLVALAFWLNGAVPVFAASFSDLYQVPWHGAETYIQRVADAGLMVGDITPSGSRVFRPRDSVTYCEVTQLAYTLLSSYYGTQATPAMQNKYLSTLQAYAVPAWAYPACSYALEKGILQVSDLSYFMKNTSQGISNNAMRENVALIFGRALANLVSLNHTSQLSFKDSASISAVSRPYIDLLVNLQIIAGDNLGNFNPKNSINRSEMAVIVSKTNDYLNSKKGPSSSSGVVSGTIQSISSVGSQKKVSVLSGSSVMDLMGNDSTPCLEKGNSIHFSALKAGDQVTISYQGQNISSVIRLVSGSSVTPSVPAGSTVSGTYVGMNNSVINIDVNGRTYSYNMANEVAFVLGGFSVTLNNMIASAEYGDKITVTLNNSNEIIKAVVTLKNDKADVKGYYKSMNDSSISLKKNKSSSSAKKYEFQGEDADNVDFYIDDSLSTYSRFKNKVSSGDIITLFYNDDEQVVEVHLEENADYDVEGYFYKINSEYISITDKKSSSAADKYYFEDEDCDNADFYIDDDNKSFSKFKDEVSSGDKIGLILNDDDEAVEVYLIDASDEDYDEEGYFKSMSDSSISLKMSKSSSSTDKYYFEDDDYDNVEFYIDDKLKSFSKFEDEVDEDDKIGLVLNRDDEVVEVYLIDSRDDDDDEDYDEEGYFHDVSSSSISVKPSRSSSADKYYFEDDDYEHVDFYIDGRSKSFSKFEDTAEKNDKIGLMLNRDDEVTEVYLLEEDDGDDSTTDLEGYFYDIDSDGKYLYFKEKISSSPEKYYFEDEDYSNVKFYIDRDSVSFSKFKYSAHNNDELDLVLNEDDEIIKAYLGMVSEEEVSGTLSMLSSSKLKLSGSSTSYTLADEDYLNIDIKDGDDSSITLLDELDEAFNEDDKIIEVDLLVDADDEVSEIEGYVSEVTGELRDFDHRRRTLDVRSSSGSIVVYTCTSSCSIKISSPSYDNDLDGLEDAFDDGKSIKVTLNLNSSGKVTAVKASW